MRSCPEAECKLLSSTTTKSVVSKPGRRWRCISFSFQTDRRKSPWGSNVDELRVSSLHNYSHERRIQSGLLRKRVESSRAHKNNCACYDNGYQRLRARMCLNRPIF